MGFDSNGIRLLLKAKKLGVNFSHVLTVGRQGLHLNKEELEGLLSKAGYQHLKLGEIKRGSYAEPILKILGSESVDSMDASDYEEASLIHDLNIAIADKLKSKYSLVIDGGSLEHIFNFPQAIKNCMEMIQEDGYYIGISPTNNFMGHGFFQFSPELYYRIFNAANGFDLIKMYYYVNQPQSPVYEVVDPEIVKQRVSLINSDPAYLFVIAKRIEKKSIFDEYPQQSDYEKILWENKTMAESSKKHKVEFSFKRLIPNFLKRIFIQNFKKQNPTGLSNPEFFKRVNDL